MDAIGKHALGAPASGEAEVGPVSLEWRLREAMRAHFGADARRVEHAERVLEHAKAIQAVSGGDRAVVVAAAILHDIGIHAAERKHGSTAGLYQEIEGPPIARRMLASLGFDARRTEQVCEIVANHHSARCPASPEFDAVWDADWLVNLPDEVDVRDAEAVARLAARVFRTAAGREMAASAHRRARGEGT